MSATIAQWSALQHAQLGTKENPPNSNITKYGPPEPWCVDEEHWAMTQLGIVLPFFSPSVVEMCLLAEQHGYWIPSTQAQEGDWTPRTWSGAQLHDPNLVRANTHMQSLLGRMGLVANLIGGNQNDPSGGIVSLDTGILGTSTFLGAIAFSRLFTTPHVGPTILGTKKADTHSPSHLYAMPMLFIGQVSNGQVVHFTKEAQQRACPHAVDGVFGPNTKQAIMDWQKGKKLTPDGVVGPLTYKSMGITS